MAIKFRSRLGNNRGNPVQNATENILGSLFGVDNQRNQLAGATAQAGLDNVLFRTANSAQDLNTKRFDEDNFQRGLSELVRRGDPRSKNLLNDVLLNRSNPNAPALARGNEAGLAFKDQQVDELTKAIANDPENTGLQDKLFAIRSGKTLLDTTKSGLARSRDDERIDALDKLNPVIKALIQSGLTGSGVSSVLQAPQKVQNLVLKGAQTKADTALTDLKGVTEVGKQDLLGVQLEKVQSVIELNDEELEFVRARNPQKISQGQAELDLAEERVLTQLQKTENEAQRTNLLTAMTQLQEAKIKLTDAKTVNTGASGLEPKDFLRAVDKRINQFRGTVPNALISTVPSLIARQEFKDTKGNLVREGQRIQGDKIPFDILTRWAEDDVRRGIGRVPQEADEALVFDTSGASDPLAGALGGAEPAPETSSNSPIDKLLGALGIGGDTDDTQVLQGFTPEQLSTRKLQIEQALGTFGVVPEKAIARLTQALQSGRLDETDSALVRQLLQEKQAKRQ